MDTMKDTTMQHVTDVAIVPEATAKTIDILRQLHDWLRGGTQWAPTMGAEAVETAIEMIERSIKLEQALKAVTKVYKSVPYAQWPTEMHFANEVLEKAK